MDWQDRYESARAAQLHALEGRLTVERDFCAKFGIFNGEVRGIATVEDIEALDRVCTKSDQATALVRAILLERLNG